MSLAAALAALAASLLLCSGSAAAQTFSTATCAAFWAGTAAFRAAEPGLGVAPGPARDLAEAFRRRALIDAPDPLAEAQAIEDDVAGMELLARAQAHLGDSQTMRLYEALASDCDPARLY